MKMVYIPDYVRKIINNWYDKADDRYYETNDNMAEFNKFIALWISFNAFYSNYAKKSSEEVNLLKIAKSFKDDFNLWSKGPEIKRFHKYINDRESGLFIKTIKWWIANIYTYKEAMKSLEKMTREQIEEINKLEESNLYDWIKLTWIEWPKWILVRKYTDQTDIKAFIFVLFQIRCNLFHGEKDPSEEADQIVVKESVLALKAFLKNLYTKEYILNPNN